MDILKEKLKVTEFKLNENSLKSSSEFNVSTHNEFELYTKTKNTKVDYGIRFNTLITSNNDNSKILTYKSEWSAELHIKNSLTDLINLRSFVENGFTKHQEYFNKTKPEQLNMTDICDNSHIDTFSSSILSQLEKNGYYK
jgi:hypothetical protein